MQSIRVFFFFLKALWLPSIREKTVNQHKYIYVFILTFESKYIYGLHFTMAYLINYYFSLFMSHVNWFVLFNLQSLDRVYDK